jgi:hypothetical protein
LPQLGYYLFASGTVAPLSPATGATGTPVPDTTPGVNHGVFYTQKIITSGKTFYCPSAKPKGPGYASVFCYEDYLTSQGQWPAFCNDPTISSYTRSSYLFYPQSRNLVNSTVPDYYNLATKTTEFDPTLAVMTDVIQNLDLLTHRVGNDKPSLAVLWGDMHVTASTTAAAFDPALWTPAPGQNAQNLQKIVARLRP